MNYRITKKEEIIEILNEIIDFLNITDFQLEKDTNLSLSDIIDFRCFHKIETTGKLIVIYEYIQKQLEIKTEILINSYNGIKMCYPELVTVELYDKVTDSKIYVETLKNIIF